jgi:type II secretion system protein J
MRRRRSSPAVCPRRGFTLLELLIATAVGAVVLLVIQTTYFGALRLHNSTHARISEDQVIQRATGIVRRDFAGLMLPGGTLTGQLQSENFSSTLAAPAGERITPDFVTNSGRIDGWTPYSEAQRVAYYLAPAGAGERGQNLVRAVTRNLLPVQEEMPEEQVVLGGVESASIQFYDGYAWVDTWDSEVTATLPSGVRFSLVLAPREGVAAAGSPIEIVVPIFATTTTSQTQAEEEAAL